MPSMLQKWYLLLSSDSRLIYHVSYLHSSLFTIPPFHLITNHTEVRNRQGDPSVEKDGYISVSILLM